ncbi:MAG: CDP-2,3-bis-(O-geranylgeranyl)-sn-glycerol synthase [Methanobacteriota archaeon]
MDPLGAALLGIWLFLPAMAPNSGAVLLGGGAPMDFGRSMKDGRRVFGDGKTWRGFFGGIACGIGLGLVQMGIAYAAGSGDYWGFSPFPGILLVFLFLSVGAMLGDLLGSFVKRRLGGERGASYPVLDIYVFVAMAILFVALFQNGWFTEHYLSDWGWLGLVTVLSLTPLLHRGVNVIGFKMGKKKVPW